MSQDPDLTATGFFGRCTRMQKMILMHYYVHVVD